VNVPIEIVSEETTFMTGESLFSFSSAARRPEPRQPKQEAPSQPTGLPTDSRPPRLVRLFSWLRRQPPGRGGPPSGSPVAGL